MKTGEKYLKIITNLFVFLAIVLAIVFVVPRVFKFFMPFVIGWILAMLANPIVKFMESHLKIVRKHSTVMVIIGALTIVILIIYIAGVNVVRQVGNLVADIPQIIESVQGDWNDIQKNMSVVYNKLPDNIQDSMANGYENLVDSFSGMVGKLGVPTVNAVGSFAQNIPSALISTIMTILSSYFFIADKERVDGILKKYTPKSIKKYILMIWKEFKRIVGGYFAAQIKIMGIVMVLLFLGFLILKVKYAILLAVLIAFLDMLPFFGTGTALGPWAVFKLLSGDYTLAIGLVVIYGITQLVRQLIQAKIVGDTIGLDPLATLFFMYIGYKLMGVLGMIIAIPTGMILISLYKFGAFDNLIRCIKEVAHDINEYRKW